MQYFVIWPDGQKFGPADVAKLNEWIGEKRINPDTDLESVVDGSRVKAKDVPGLTFPDEGTSTPQVPGETATPETPETPTPSAAPVGVPQDPSPASPTTDAPTYFVPGAGGQKYGPADIPTLTQWASENRLTPTTELEDSATGQKIPASQVSGIVFPMASGAQAASQNPVTPASSPYGGEQSNQANSQNPYAQYPRQDSFDDEQQRKNATISIVLSIVGIFCCCVLNIVGIVMAYKVKETGHPMGKTAVTVGWICLGVALLIGIISAIVQFGAIAAAGAGGGF